MIKSKEVEEGYSDIIWKVDIRISNDIIVE